MGKTITSDKCSRGVADGIDNSAKFEEIKASGKLPSPKGVALQVVKLTKKDGVSSQEISHVVKADPVLSGKLIKAANSLIDYQSRPIVSVVDAVGVLGLNMVRCAVDHH